MKFFEDAQEQNKKKRVKVKFTLTMIKPVVEGKTFDEIGISWTNVITNSELDKISTEWLDEANSLVKRMKGLDKVGEHSLTVEQVQWLDN